MRRDDRDAYQAWLVGELLLVGLLGGLVFLTIGFAIAGAARTEDQAAPLANIVSMPQMFLSGIFFSTATLPAWLKPVAALFPLTFFADAAREVSTQGAHLWDVSKDLAGLAVWLVVGFAVAARLFHYD
jgi:ABC-2 type transport system permease protein